MTFNVSFIHKNLALRWLYVTKGFHDAIVWEFTLKSSIPDIIRMIDQEKFDVIGMSVYIFNHEKSSDFIQQLKKLRPDIMIIVGGPEPTYQVKQWLNYGADIVIRGEGEFAFWDAVDGHISAGIATPDQPHTSILTVDLNDLEVLDDPYFLPFDQHDQSKRYLYVEASRGCPFACTYCMAGIEHNVRQFSLEYMTSVFEKLRVSNIKQVKFLDRTFNLKPSRAMKLIQILNEIDREINIQLELEVSIWDEQLHRYLIDHGHRDRFRFEIGVQSFFEPTLQAVKRKQNNDKVEEVITSLSRAGYVVHADLIAVLPFETYDQFEKSFLRLFETQPSELQLGILKVLSGTQIAKEEPKYKMHYQQTPPYQISSNPWISALQIKRLNHVALAIDKTYNRPLCRTLYWHVYQKDLALFELLGDIGSKIDELSHPYQLKDIIDIVIDVASGMLDQRIVVAAIATDMGKWSHKKPMGLPYFDKTTLDMTKMIMDIEHRTKQKKDQWISSSWFYPALIDQSVGYQWIVYPHKKRYYYTEKGDFMDEQDHFAGID